MTEGMLVGGSCGLAVHAALEVARGHRRPGRDGRGDPARRRARLPVEDLQRRLDDASTASWSATRGPHGRRRAAAPRRRPARSRRSSPSRTAPAGARRDRAAARAPRLAAAGRVRARPGRSSARSASAGCSSARSTTPRSWAREIVDVMEPPFPAVSTTDPVREAVELLSGDRQALLVTERGPAGGHRHPRRPAGGTGLMTESETRASRRARSTPASSPTRATARSSPRSTRPRRTCSRAPGEFVERLRLLARANPTRARARARARRARGRPRHRVRVRHGRRARADHGRLRGRRSRRDPRRPLRRHLPARRQGARAAGASTYTMVDQTDLDALSAAVGDDTRLIWVETPTNPTLNVVDIAAVVARKRDAFVAVDNTFATPINQRPLELGADAVRPLDDEVPRRALRHRRRRRDRRASRRCTSGALRAERGRRGARAAGLLPHASRPAHAAPADGARTARTRTAVERVAARRRRRHDVRWPGFSGMVSFRHPDAAGSPRAPGCSRSPSRSAAWSR